MLKNRDIIIFGDDWGFYPSTIQHIGKILLKQNRIFWIGSLGLRKPKLQLYDIYRIFKKGRNIFIKNNNTKSSSPVIQLYPFILPFHDLKYIRKLNTISLLIFLKRKIIQYKIKNPILITSNPIIAEIIGKLGESSSHYICLDDFTKFDGAFKSIEYLENKLLEKVDSSFSVSQKLIFSRVPKTGHSYYLPQGVDIEHFSPFDKSIPKTVANLKRPIIGFFGLLTPWVDIELIIETAKKFDNTTILLLGRTNIDISHISTIKNIVYLGEIPYDKLPSFAQVFDVGLIPFVVNNLTIAANPLKLLEYFALGIPVVSSKLPEVEKFNKYAYIADDSESFINLIKTALDEDSREKRNERRELAKRYSWYQITQNISDKIIEIENNK